MKRNKKVAVLNKGVRLTDELAARELEDVTGGKGTVVNRNVGCGGPNECVAVQQY